MAKEKFEPGAEGCETAFDLGWKHAVEDRPFGRDYSFTDDDFDEYREGYNQAKDGFQ